LTESYIFSLIAFYGEKKYIAAKMNIPNNNNNNNNNKTTTTTTTTPIIMPIKEQSTQLKQKQTIKQVNLKNESFNTINPFSGNNINWNSINLNNNFPMFNFASKSKVFFCSRIQQ